MGVMTTPQILPVERPETANEPEAARPWVTVVHDDPVNLMTYVVFVFQKLFGFSRETAETLMMDVHTKGRAIVSHGARERMEYDAARLHTYGLWATVDKR
jgi:ATP-dependent Clp protease adaptor protein ClpS